MQPAFSRFAALASLALLCTCGSGVDASGSPASIELEGSRARTTLATADPPDPGALVAVTFNSTVGVVLDEIPVSQRTRVANQFLRQPGSFWLPRAKKQIEHTYYRLIYRDFYYASGNGDTGTREMMPITQPELWNLSLGGVATRVTYQGHDAVVIDYSMTTTVLTKEDQPRIVEPHLGKVGGTWDEPFHLPLDPELVLQRTGLACIDESGYPPSTFDTENEAFLFDQECEVETPGQLSCHLTLPLPTESCMDSLVAHIGRVDTLMHFERLAWNAALANQVRVGAYTQPTADLQPVVEGLQDNRVAYRYIAPDSCAIQEGCVAGPGWRRVLQFTSTVKNTGGQPLVAGSVADGSPYRVHNVFEFSACHQHYHFSHYGSFNFGSLPGEKRAFCLESTNRFFNSETTPWAHPYGCDNQGIESGWGDDYIAGIECQWIDVTGASGGTQNLTFLSNPDRFLCEGAVVTDASGNQLWEPTSFVGENGLPVDRPVCTIPSAALSNNFASLQVALPATGGYTLKACPPGRTGPLRDCGWRETPVRTCTPGSTVTLTCKQRKDSDPLQAVRVCEASAVLGGTSCAFYDSLSNKVVEGNTTVSFTCPVARDATEPGGRYSLYLAPVVDGDPPATITCN